MRAYVQPRIGWQATPRDLVDAALAACVKEQSAIHEALVMAGGMNAAEIQQFMAHYIEQVRIVLIKLILEVRNQPAS